MAYYLDAALAQEIVTRTMQIIDCNVNVMDANGRIIGSGDPARLGELHEGALLVLSQKRTVEIDDSMSKNLHGVRHGINLPLELEGQIVGVVGMTGDPAVWRQFGAFAQMTAEMMLEQARLMRLLAQDQRLREELVLSLIRSEETPPTLIEWGQRLGVDLMQPRVVAVIEVGSGELGSNAVQQELEELQTLLKYPERDNLVATISLTELVVLKPVTVKDEQWNYAVHRQRVEELLSRMRAQSRVGVRIALGNYFPGAGGLARSYRTASLALQVGKRRQPEQHAYFYQDLALPILLDNLRDSWQSREILSPLRKLKAHDQNGQLRKTLWGWFLHNTQPSATAQALFIHRNTLEYRLHRIAEITGLNLSHFDDRLLLYIGLQLDDDVE
jgi:carbohydrate diacid regulator